MPLLDVRSLSVTYHGRGEAVRAVDGVSFTLDTGRILALVGESGSGKSTVALALTRLLPPGTALAGSARFEGTDLLTASEPALRAIRGGRIAYVFQDPATSLNPVMTVGAQLREAIELHTEHRRAAADQVAVEWLERVGIRDARRRLSAYPHELSGGMQQRAMMAMALAGRPMLLVADEPTTALDVTVQVQLLRLLRDLQRELGLAILLISHDLLVVERIAHDVAVMQRGRIVEQGAVDVAFRQPVHPYTRELLASRPRVRLRPERPKA